MGLAPKEQDALLAGHDARVADEVRSLLQHADADSQQSRVDEILAPPYDLPEHIGAYRIDRLLGQGGMGSVFLARRTGEFDQLVAVKVIRREFGLAARSLERRFRKERQILASLQHPYIAHLLDGGTSEGYPYLVVEYVPGERIDEYCNHARLSIRQRIELFLKICGAAQYAHQNLIIHRDLKPANVLVLADGTPKLLDFGIAKLLREEDSAPELTHTAMRIFTPGYASPEQLRGESVGTASDVYSLGVMLYELLTGQKPHLVGTGSDLALFEAVCHETPPLASAAIKRYQAEEREAKAEERATTFAAWSRILRNDLDLILSRAISVDVTRRYQSVEQLSSDIERYLSQLPISARKDTWIYRARKFSSRHSALVSVTSLAFLILLGAGLVLFRQNRLVIQQRQRAERRFNDLRSLAHSNITEVQDALDRVPGGTEVRALLLRRALQYLDGLSAEKDNDIDLERDLATAYAMFARRLGNPAASNLGDTDAANANYDRCIQIRESILKLPQANENDQFLLIHVLYEKALMQQVAGHLEVARQTIAQAANTSDAILANHPHDLTRALNAVGLTHRTLANILLENGAGPSLADPVQALAHADIALRSIEAANKRQPTNPNLLENLIQFQGTKAELLYASGREDEGLKLQKSTVDLGLAASSRMNGEFYQLLLFDKYVYGLELAKQNPRKGLPWMESALATVAKARAADPADMKLTRWYAIGMTTAGNVRRRAGDRRTGLNMMHEGMAELERLLAKNFTPSGELRYPLATGYRGLGDDALGQGNLPQALVEYENAERTYAQDAAAVPEDLDVYPKRSENMLSIAALQAKLGLVRDAASSRRLAIEYADRVLKVHPDNPVAEKLRRQAIVANETR